MKAGATRWVWTLVGVVITAVVLFCGSILHSGSQERPAEDMQTITVAEKTASGIGFNARSLAATEAAVGTERVTATVSPVNAIYQLQWTIAWEDPDDDRPISAYLTIEEIDRNTIDLHCHQRYHGAAILRCEVRNRPSVYATASVRAPIASDLQIGYYKLSGSAKVAQVSAEIENALRDTGYTISPHTTDAAELVQTLRDLISQDQLSHLIVVDEGDRLSEALRGSIKDEMQTAGIPVVLVNTSGGGTYDWSGSTITEFSAYPPGADRVVSDLASVWSSELNADTRVLRFAGDDGFGDQFVSMTQELLDYAGIAELHGDYIYEPGDLSAIAEGAIQEIGEEFDAIFLDDSAEVGAILDMLSAAGMSVDQIRWIIWEADEASIAEIRTNGGEILAYKRTVNAYAIADYLMDLEAGAPGQEYTLFAYELVV